MASSREAYVEEQQLAFNMMEALRHITLPAFFHSSLKISSHLPHSLLTFTRTYTQTTYTHIYTFLPHIIEMRPCYSNTKYILFYDRKTSLRNAEDLMLRIPFTNFVG